MVVDSTWCSGESSSAYTLDKKVIRPGEYAEHKGRLYFRRHGETWCKVGQTTLLDLDFVFGGRALPVAGALVLPPKTRKLFVLFDGGCVLHPSGWVEGIIDSGLRGKDGRRITTTLRLRVKAHLDKGPIKIDNMSELSRVANYMGVMSTDLTTRNWRICSATVGSKVVSAPVEMSNDDEPSIPARYAEFRPKALFVGSDPVELRRFGGGTVFSARLVRSILKSTRTDVVTLTTDGGIANPSFYLQGVSPASVAGRLNTKWVVNSNYTQTT